MPATATIHSIRDLAKRLKLSHTAVGRWVKRDDWKFGPGPWAPSDLPRIQIWAKRTLTPAAVPGEAGAKPDPHETLADLPLARRADIALKMSRRDRVVFDLQRDKELFHRLDECRQNRLQQIHEVKTAFLNMADGLPLAPDDKTIVKGRVLEILRSFEQGVPPAPADAAADKTAPGPPKR